MKLLPKAEPKEVQPTVLYVCPNKWAHDGKLLVIYILIGGKFYDDPSSDAATVVLRANIKALVIEHKCMLCQIRERAS